MTPERVIEALARHPKLACQVAAGLQSVQILQPWAEFGPPRNRIWRRHIIGSEKIVVQVGRVGEEWEVWHTCSVGMTRLEQGNHYDDILEAQRVADKWAVAQGWTLSEPL